MNQEESEQDEVDRMKKEADSSVLYSCYFICPLLSAFSKIFQICENINIFRRIDVSPMSAQQQRLY